MTSDGQTKVQTVEFSGLILGFSSAALYYMGHADVEGRRIDKPNLPLAHQNVQIIELLHEKTRGNLTTDESKLIDELLRDLRLKLVLKR